MLGVMTVRKEEPKFREFDRYRGFIAGFAAPSPALRQSAAGWRLAFEMTFYPCC